MFAFEYLGTDFMWRFCINLAALVLLIRFGLCSKAHKYSTFFIYHMFGVGVFLVTYALKFQEMSLGFAFGLFAIFSMLRYRTELLTIRQMTYLFLVIVNALLCAVGPLSPPEMAIVAVLIVGLALASEAFTAAQRVGQQTVRYEKIENIRPENRSKLLQDLAERTGLRVLDVQIQSIDFLQDCAMLNLVYALDTDMQEVPAPQGLPLRHDAAEASSL
jgi:hypothetical protein